MPRAGVRPARLQDLFRARRASLPRLSRARVWVPGRGQATARAATRGQAASEAQLTAMEPRRLARDDEAERNVGKHVCQVAGEGGRSRYCCACAFKRAPDEDRSQSASATAPEATLGPNRLIAALNVHPKPRDSSVGVVRTSRVARSSRFTKSIGLAANGSGTNVTDQTTCSISRSTIDLTTCLIRFHINK